MTGPTRIIEDPRRREDGHGEEGIRRRRVPCDRRNRHQQALVGGCHQNAVETATRSLRDLRIAEVQKLDVKIDNGKIVAYRARVQVSFKYEV